MSDYVPHHQLFSPSKSERWLTCTASVQACKDAPRTSSSYAAEGTLAHWVFEEILTGKTKLHANSTRVIDEHKVTVDQAMLTHCEDAVAYVQELGSGVVFTEQTMSLTLDGKQLFGTADVLVITDDDPEHLHVMDFKYGKGVKVEAMGNSQMRLYGGAAIQTLAFMYDSFDTITTHVMQPRLNHYDSETLKVSELYDWLMGTVEPAMKDALNGGTFKPSPNACRFCPIAPCDAALEGTLDLFENTPDNAMLATTDTSVLVKFMDDIELIELICKQARDRTFEMLAQGVDVEGWKLVEGRSIRQWGDEDAVEDRLQAFDVDDVEIYTTPKLKSPAQMEKLFGNGLPTEIAELVHKPPGKPTLAKASDKRPALTLQATVDDFDDEGEGE